MSTDADDQLSPHFFLSELTVSNEGARKGLRNTPYASQVENLRRLAALLEDVCRALGDHPILVSSAFRSPAVNTLVHGTRHSAHLDGLAADFICPAFGNPRRVCQRIVDVGIVFDQLIHEGRWVHLGLAATGKVPRRELLTAKFQQLAAPLYLPGIV